MRWHIYEKSWRTGRWERITTDGEGLTTSDARLLWEPGGLIVSASLQEDGPGLLPDFLPMGSVLRMPDPTSKPTPAPSIARRLRRFATSPSGASRQA